MRITSKVKSYIHKSLNNVPGKWKSIALTNLAAEMTLEELNDTIYQLQPKIIELMEQKVERLLDLKAPDIIMDPILKLLEKSIDKRHPDLRILNKGIDKRK